MPLPQNMLSKLSTKIYYFQFILQFWLSLSIKSHILHVHVDYRIIKHLLPLNLSSLETSDVMWEMSANLWSFSNIFYSKETANPFIPLQWQVIFFTSVTFIANGKYLWRSHIYCNTCTWFSFASWYTTTSLCLRLFSDF